MKRWRVDWQAEWGPFYLDVVGSFADFAVGAVLRLTPDGEVPWGNCLSVYLGPLCISVGYEKVSE